ncbi:MAG: CBS domain-containing protein [Nitrospinae bacterium]|nr:CBS domain-containing protein [Nitrospinota bacterium]
MFVGEAMTKKVITLLPEENVVSALRLMVQNNVRHLPVVDAQDSEKLVGIISGRDIKLTMHSDDDLSGNSHMLIKDIMQKSVVTVTSQTFIQDAAKLIHSKKYGALPVVDQGKLIGIITSQDIIGIFIEIMDTLEKSARIDVEISGRAGIDEVRCLLEEEGCEILGVGLLPENEQESIFSFRISHRDTLPLKNLLNDAGYNVIEHIC